MRYLIGLFGSVGETEGVLCTETGLVLRKHTEKSLPVLLESLTEGIPLEKTAVLAGLANREDLCRAAEKIEKRVPGKVQASCENFAASMLRSCLGKTRDGAVLHLHMTAGAAARRNGAMHFIGGDGAPAWSPGGSVSVGQAALSAAFAAAEKRGPATSLVRHLERAVGMPLAETEDLREAADGKTAAYARLAWQGARFGDRVSLEITERAMEACLGYLSAVTADFTEKVPLYILGAGKEEAEMIKAAVSGRFPERFAILFSDTPPIFGAVCGAAELLGIKADAKFEKYFAETFSIYEE